ncbi:MAG: hypothetical protein ABI288_10610 [Ginsengibacter sp.]
MKFLITVSFTFLLILIAVVGHSQDHQYDPSLNTPPASSLNFTIPGIDNVPDLYGDIIDPQLVVFFAGIKSRASSAGCQRFYEIPCGQNCKRHLS